MKKVINKIMFVPRFVVAFMWFLGLYIAGAVIAVRKAKAEFPGARTVDAMNIIDFELVANHALKVLGEKYGKPDIHI